MIKCDFEKCSANCRYYNSCILHQTSHFNQLRIEDNLKWNVNRLNELTTGINRYKQSLNQYYELPKTVRKHIQRDEFKELIKKAETEKKEIQQEIRELQIKELNIRKILER